jgi:sugar lactone lactonase YvrE
VNDDADPDLRVAVASPAVLGESPFWHPREQVLYYCDIAGRRLNRFDPQRDDLVHWDFDSEPACCAPRLDGDLLLGMRDGLWRFDPESARLRRIAKPPYDPKTERFNDGKCDPQGRFWVGTIYEPREPKAVLYCLVDGVLERRAEGITTLNGLGWSPSGSTLYWSDTRAHTIYAAGFDPATGEPSGRHVFASFPPKPEGPLPDDYGGRPDGAAVDVEGCYWVAMFEGRRVLRLSPDGEVLREVRLPVRCPTMPCFGGHDLKTLYITTSRENRPMAELAREPYAGCVLSLRVDVPGLPVNVFD